MKALVHVRLKREVLDPQGAAIQRATASLGYDAVTAVRQGKLFELEVAESDEARARALVGELCEKLLANTVIEDYEIVSLAP